MGFPRKDRIRYYRAGMVGDETQYVAVFPPPPYYYPWTDAVGSVLLPGGARPVLGGQTLPATAWSGYFADRQHRRVEFDEMPVVWQDAFRAYLGAGATVRGAQRIKHALTDEERAVALVAIDWALGGTNNPRAQRELLYLQRVVLAPDAPAFVDVRQMRRLVRQFHRRDR